MSPLFRKVSCGAASARSGSFIWAACVLAPNSSNGLPDDSRGGPWGELLSAQRPRAISIGVCTPTRLRQCRPEPSSARRRPPLRLVRRGSSSRRRQGGPNPVGATLVVAPLAPLTQLVPQCFRRRSHPPKQQCRRAQPLPGVSPSFFPFQLSRRSSCARPIARAGALKPL